jgi:hypothetical protein
MLAALRDSAFFGIMPGVVFVVVIIGILAIVYFARRWIG